MKIEFIYKDNTYEPIIDELNQSLNLEENEITYTPIVQVGLNIFSFNKSGDNEPTAKKLDEIKQAIIKSLDSNNLFIITDGVSSYFCQRLYPQMANFERALRKVLYLASIKSQDEKAIDICKKIEEKEFAEIYQLLFSDTNYVLEAKKIVNSNSPALSKYDIIKKLNSLSESTLWNKLFNDQYSYIPENFLEIKNGRNKTMHSRNISYEEYSEIKNNVEKANKLLKQIEFDVLEKENFNSYLIVDSIIEALKTLSKTVVKATSNMLLYTFSEYFKNNMLTNYNPQLEEALPLDTTNDIIDVGEEKEENDEQDENAQSEQG